MTDPEQQEVRSDGSARREDAVLVAQFIRFAASGAVGTAGHYVTLALMVEVFGVGPVPGSIAGFAVGAATNYALSRRFVFRSSTSHRTGIPRFLTVAMLGVIINTAVVWLLTTHTPAHYMVAQFAATAVVLLWNFIGNRFWTFAQV